MLGTSTTPYDLRFRFLDIPVRIHPLFWLMSAVLGFQENNIPAVLIWIGCVLVSILVHEYGHGLMAKHFHGSPSIVLYGLGGLCCFPGGTNSRPAPGGPLRGSRRRVYSVRSGPRGHIAGAGSHRR